MPKLSLSQDIEIAEMLALGRTPTEIGKALGVSRATVYRRMDSPEFVQQVRAMRSKVVEAVLGGLTHAAIRAVAVLNEAMGVGALSPEAFRAWRVRLPAAQTALSSRLSLADEVDISQRLDALEQLARKGLPPFGGSHGD